MQHTSQHDPSGSIFRSLFESAPDAVVVIEPGGDIVLVNAQTERLFGYPREALLGQPVEILLPTRFHDAHRPNRQGYVADPRARPMGAGLELFGRHADGTEFPVDISLSPLETPDGVRFAAAVRDITVRKRIEAKFRAFLESAPDAVVIIDPSGDIVQVNAQTERIFGHPRDAMLGHPVEMLLPARFRAAHGGHRTSFLADPRARAMGADLELFGLRGDGSEFPVDISLSPLETEDGLLLAANVRDVTERRRLERVRDEFIANAAHELRTPLATLSMLGELLASKFDEMPTEQRDGCLVALRRQSDRASVLVTNLLDLTQLQAGRLIVHLEPVDVAVLIERVLESAPAPEGVSVVPEVEKGVVVRADRTQLERVLTNLLSNAYRYGGRSIRIDAEAQGSHTTITVSDDGAGVEAELIPELFEPFTRGKAAGTVGGSGIGLALCRRLVEAADGTLSFTPGTPSGARFTLRMQRP